MLHKQSVVENPCRYSRGWFYHKEHQLWFMRANVEPLVKTQTYERGTYVCFDPNTWETRTKVRSQASFVSFYLFVLWYSHVGCIGRVLQENFVLQYEAVDKKPTLPPARP